MYFLLRSDFSLSLDSEEGVCYDITSRIVHRL